MFQGDETVSINVLRQKELVRFEELEECRCGWSPMHERGGEKMRDGLGHLELCRLWWGGRVLF